MSFYKFGSGFLKVTGGSGYFARPNELPEDPPGGGGGGTGTPSGKSMLTQSDISYVGYWNLSIDVDNLARGQAMTHRYVNGEFRLLVLSKHSSGQQHRLREIVPPALNGTRTSYNRSWTSPWASKYGTASGYHMGLHWDEATSRLYTNAAIDYPNTTEQKNRTVCTVVTELGDASESVTSVRGRFGLEGIGARSHYGGLVRVPSWFQTSHGTGPFATGYGGYGSLMAQGLGPRLGFCLWAMPDPIAAGLADDTDFTTSQFKTLADCGSASAGGTDWYYGTSQTTPTTLDRGHRLTGYHENYFDGGNIHFTQEALHWRIAPDGRHRWTWGDSYYDNCVWIDGTTKHGFLAVATLHDGVTYYDNSTLNWDSRGVEFHLFNPDHFGEVVQGTRQPANVGPTAMWRPAEIVPNASYSGVGNAPTGAVSGVTYDSTTGRLYVRRLYMTGGTDRIHIYQVNV